MVYYIYIYIYIYMCVCIKQLLLKCVPVLMLCFRYILQLLLEMCPSSNAVLYVHIYITVITRNLSQF